MGKRKSSAKPVKRIKQTLDTQFQCLFCNHEKSVICTLDKKNSLGELHCKICGQSFQTSINSLSQPVDIYSDWIDACEELNSEQKVNENDVHNEDDDGEYDDEDADEPRKRAVVDDSDDDGY